MLPPPCRVCGFKQTSWRAHRSGAHYCPPKPAPLPVVATAPGVAVVDSPGRHRPSLRRGLLPLMLAHILAAGSGGSK